MLPGLWHWFRWAPTKGALDGASLQENSGVGWQCYQGIHRSAVGGDLGTRTKGLATGVMSVGECRGRALVAQAKGRVLVLPWFL